MPISNVELQQAIVAEINGGSYTAPYSSVTAVRSYLPEHKLETLDALKVDVVPAARRRTPADRSRDQFDHEIHVVLHKRLDLDHETLDVDQQCDQLAMLAEELETQLNRKGLVEGVAFVGLNNEPIFEPDKLHEHNVFMSVIRLNYREVR